MHIITSYINRFKDKIGALLSGPHADKWLFFISFAESSFFPLPPDFFLFPMATRMPEKAYGRAFLTTVASVIGGLFGYAIGFFLFEVIGAKLVAFYHLEASLAVVEQAFNKHVFLAILTAAFTPIPYKLFTIAGGLFHVALLPFTIASIIGRGLRFYIVAWVGRRLGVVAGEKVIKHFNTATAVLAVIAVGYIVFTLFS